jgi:hypothetical protein
MGLALGAAMLGRRVGSVIGSVLRWLGLSLQSSRAIVRITNPAAGETIVCEALHLDDSFLTHYNQGRRITIDTPESVAVMSGWYRARLGGLHTQQDYAN